MRDKLGRFMKGHQMSENQKRIVSDSLKGNTWGFQKGHTPWNTGSRVNSFNCLYCNNLKETSDHRNKFCSKPCSIKYYNERGVTGFPKGVLSSPKPFKKGRKPTIEEIKKCLQKREKSSLEIKFENIINKLGLPYKFVGNGEVIVVRKNPDFVDKNGKKTAIEVYYRKHKEEFRNGVEQWKAERLRIFNEEGWELIFFDEKEVNENTVKSVLGV